MVNVVKTIQQENEKGARASVIEELFYDLNRSRSQVYWTNFVRGIFFGVGSVIGGTVVIAVLIWILGAFVNVFPPLADFINGIIDAMNQRR
jgi:hypothetical protein